MLISNITQAIGTSERRAGDSTKKVGASEFVGRIGFFEWILGSRGDLPTYGSSSAKLKDARLKYHVALPPG